MTDFDYSSLPEEGDTGLELQTKTQACLDELRTFLGAVSGSTSVLDHNNLARDAGIRVSQFAGNIPRTKLAAAGEGRAAITENFELGAADADTLKNADAISMRTLALRDSPRFARCVRTSETGLTRLRGVKSVTLADGADHTQVATVSWSDDDDSYSGTPTRWRIGLTRLSGNDAWASTTPRKIIEIYWDTAGGASFRLVVRRWEWGGAVYALTVPPSGDEVYNVEWRAVVK